MAMLEEAKRKIEPAAPVRQIKLKKKPEAPAPEPPKMEETKPVRIIKLKKKPEAAPAPEPVKTPDTLAKYLKGYTGNFQDYEDSRNEEVMYPTSDIKKIITLAYQGKSLSEIQKEVGYNKEETAIMIYDHFINRNMKAPKSYKDEQSVMTIVNKYS
jgi:hypothetical protein